MCSASRPNHDGAPRAAVARHTHKARRRRHTRLVSSRRGDGVWTALTSRHRSDGRGDGVEAARRRRRDARRAIAAAATRRRRTQVHAAFDVQDTEAWSNADDLRTPSEVKAELARLRQLALACVTAKMDNKKVNDKIDLNAPKKAAVYKAPLVREAIARCLSSNPLIQAVPAGGERRIVRTVRESPIYEG